MNDPLVSDVTASMPELRRYALRLTRNPDDADDLVQDCMVRALSKLHLFERGTNLEAWLTTILRNLFLNRCKTARRNVEVELEQDTAVTARQDHQIELKEVGQAFSRLTDEQKFLVRRCGLEGRSYKAVAAQLGVSMGTVRSRLNRARHRLREFAAAPRRITVRPLVRATAPPQASQPHCMTRVQSPEPARTRQPQPARPPATVRSAPFQAHANERRPPSLWVEASSVAFPAHSVETAFRAGLASRSKPTAPPSWPVILPALAPLDPWLCAQIYISQTCNTRHCCRFSGVMVSKAGPLSIYGLHQRRIYEAPYPGRYRYLPPPAEQSSPPPAKAGHQGLLTVGCENTAMICSGKVAAIPIDKMPVQTGFIGRLAAIAA